MASGAGSWIPPTLHSDGLSDAAGCVLLDMSCYIANRPNATTAKGFTSRGLPIELTFHAARPPVLSHLSVHCPGMDFPGSAPKVVATHADFVLLRVPINPDALYIASTEPWDYFIYRAAQPPLLHLLPNPYPKQRFNDAEAAVLSRDGGGYVVAALRSRVPRRDPNSGEMVRNEFDLHLYRSDVADEGWVSKRLSVAEPTRDKLVPLPEADILMYHESGKAITIGGKRGTVAWVDLWRGIILCDALDDCPVLRDVPLPPPAMGNWDYLLQECSPNLFRDVAISRSKDSIKYVEMEIQPLKQSSDGWKATMWSMPIPVGSWEDWRRDYEVDVDEVVVEGVEELWLAKLPGSGTETTLHGLTMIYPTISMDDEVCFLSMANGLEVLVAIDGKEKMLRGVAELDSQKDFSLMPSYCSSEISLHLKEITGTLEPLKSTEKETVEPKITEVHAKELTRRGRRKKHVWRRVPLSDAVQFQVI
ncbi:hypothetical protein EJB05_46028 [Eragrostis curvula]|uniref:DUF1618 domain-containing protein n=1 Tax=Eragrostis curvula TaxID=38414 RepID=A0A5J9TMH0_9POAL|nr:hypothetical protein EJB05_46028 [Eragrostis curvula]